MKPLTFRELLHWGRKLRGFNYTHLQVRICLIGIKLGARDYTLE